MIWYGVVRILKKNYTFLIGHEFQNTFTVTLVFIFFVSIIFVQFLKASKVNGFHMIS